MVDMLRGGTLLAATLAMGLMAGVYYAFSIAVMPGLARASDRTFVEAMQQVNRAILNGWFALVFGGSFVLAVVAALLHLPANHRSALPWIAAGLVLYAVTLVITFTVNVPLNDALDGAGAPDGITDLAAVRARFEATWVRWNVVRAVLCTAGFGCLAWALVLAGRVTAA